MTRIAAVAFVPVVKRQKSSIEAESIVITSPTRISTFSPVRTHRDVLFYLN